MSQMEQLIQNWKAQRAFRSVARRVSKRAVKAAGKGRGFWGKGTRVIPSSCIK